MTNVPHEYTRIPERTKSALLRYRDERIGTGSFLRAVLANNLNDAAATADPDNFRALREIMLFCRYELPEDAWGSTARVQAWLMGHTPDENDAAKRIQHQKAFPHLYGTEKPMPRDRDKGDFSWTF